VGAAWDAAGASGIEDPGTWAKVDAPATSLALPSLQGSEPRGYMVGALWLCAAVDTGPPMWCTVGAGPAAASMRGVGSHGGNWRETPIAVQETTPFIMSTNDWL
jgi:hypothetical protein